MSWEVLLGTHGELGFFQPNDFINFLGLALAGLQQSARTQNKPLIFVLCVDLNHLGNLVRTRDSLPPARRFRLTLGHGGWGEAFASQQASWVIQCRWSPLLALLKNAALDVNRGLPQQLLE